MAAGGAVRASKVDDLQVQPPPAFGGPQRFQIELGLHNAAAAAEPPARGQAVNVRIHREGGVPETLAHHHAGALVAHAGQSFQLRKAFGHLAAMLRDNLRRKRAQIFRLGGSESATADEAADARHRRARHGLRRGRGGEESRRYLVHALIGALRRKHHRHQKLKRIAVPQRRRRLRKQSVEDGANALRLGSPRAARLRHCRAA